MKHKGDPCDASMCPSLVTHALLYGCFNEHIQERYLCEMHVALYKAITANLTCQECELPYEEWLDSAL